MPLTWAPNSLPIELLQARRKRNCGPRRKKGNSWCRKCCINVLAKWPIIDPRTSLCLEKWDRLMVCLLVLNIFGAPYETAFMELEMHGIFVLTRFGDVLFGLDMFLQLFTAEPDPKRPGFYIKDPVVMFVSYLTGWFVLDFLTVLPSLLEYHLYWDAPETAPSIFRYLWLCRIVRVRSLYQIGKRMTSSLGLNNQAMAIGWSLFVASVCSHWMACVWGGVAFQAEKGEGTTWIDALDNTKGGDVELYRTGFGVYSLALYWAIVTLTSIGYGDIVPQTELEYWIAAVCMMLMAFTWAFVIGEICGVVATLSPHKVSYNQTMDDINWLMRDRNFSPVSRKAFRRYVNESQNLQRLEQQKPIVNRMSPMLQGEVSMHMLGAWVDKVPYLKIMPKEIICTLARKLDAVLYAPSEIVPNERALFIVHRGMCCNAGKILMADDVWGEDSILNNSVLRKTYQVKCLSYLEAFELHHWTLHASVDLDWKAAKKMRWSAVKLSTMRAFNMIARAAGIWNNARCVQTQFHELDTVQMKRLISAILNGEFDVHAHDQRAVERQVMALYHKADTSEAEADVPSRESLPTRETTSLSNSSKPSKQKVKPTGSRSGGIFRKSQSPKAATLQDLYALLFGMQEKLKNNEKEINAIHQYVLETTPC